MGLEKESPEITGKRKESPLSDEQINEVGEKPLDSNNSMLTTHVRQRSKSRKTAGVPSGKFKGVVPQQNGNWGAQIYANHQRIWLGTFKTEHDAAMAYDSAAIKLRSGDSHRNFPWTHDSIEEPRFQSTYSTQAVLNMIKEGTYQSKFNEFLRTRSERPEAHVNVNSWFHENGGVLCRPLFQKELTPSDVGKLNRLVIPKKYAIKYFPNIRESAGENGAGGGEVNDMQLVFYDKLMRSWKFRYCYWSSSQSFVFTKGWSRFVKEKALKAGDLIAFYLYDCREPSKEPRTLCVIDVCRKEANGKYADEGVEQNIFAANGELQFELGEDVVSDDNESPAHDDVSGRLEAVVETKGFKLFGVEIN